MTTHKVEVVRISAIEPIPGAERVEAAKVFGYTCVVKKGDYQAGDLAIYIEPDYVVPDTAPFAFLQGKRRIKSRRLLGVWSQGLLMKLSDFSFPGLALEGDNVMEELGIERYVPPADREPARGQGGKLGPSWSEKQPKHFPPFRAYGLENYRRNQHLLDPLEEVYVTEKVHGCNARYRWADGRMWVGSRNGWKSWRSGNETRWQIFLFTLRAWLCTLFPSIGASWRTPNAQHNVWWKALAAHPEIEDFCRAKPYFTVFGEVYGDVQDLKYGAASGEVRFVAFDIQAEWSGDGFVNPYAFHLFTGGTVGGPKLPTAPLLYRGPADPAKLEELSRIESTFVSWLYEPHIGEGIVIKPIDGRVALKLVSDLYLERAK